MSTTDEPQQSDTIRSLIEEAAVAAHESRTRFRQAKGRHGTVPQQIHDEVRDALVRYYDALQRFKSKNSVRQDWEEHNFDDIRALINQSQSTTRPKPGSRGQVVETVKIPLMQQVDTEVLVEKLEDLDDIATKLGLSAEVNEEPPKDKGTKEDLRWLLATRDQKAALEDIIPPEYRQEEGDDGEGVSDDGDDGE